MPESEMISVCLNFKKLPILFAKYHFTVLPTVHESSVAPHLYLIAMVRLYHFRLSNEYLAMSLGLNLHFPND